MHYELAALVGVGLSPYEALLAGTRHPAAYFGTLDSTGTIAVHKRADLVLLYDNPLQDIRHMREPAGVMLGGRRLDRAALDRELTTPRGWWMMKMSAGLSPTPSAAQSTALPTIGRSCGR